MAPVPGDSSKHQFGTSMPQGGHPPHHSITSSARASSAAGSLRCGRTGAAQLANDLAVKEIVNLWAGGSAAVKSMLAKAPE
jgi:hypothetical protein